MSEVGSDALLALDDSLRRLEKHDRRQSRIVECRFFGGMTIEETAEALGVSPGYRESQLGDRPGVAVSRPEAARLVDGQ